MSARTFEGSRPHSPTHSACAYKVNIPKIQMLRLRHYCILPLLSRSGQCHIPGGHESLRCFRSPAGGHWQNVDVLGQNEGRDLHYPYLVYLRGSDLGGDSKNFSEMGFCMVIGVLTSMERSAKLEILCMEPSNFKGIRHHFGPCAFHYWIWQHIPCVMLQSWQHRRSCPVACFSPVICR